MLSDDARLLVENPFVEHDYSSNTTAGRKKTVKSDTWSILFLTEVRHLVEKKSTKCQTLLFSKQVSNFFTWHRPLQKSDWLTRLIGKLSSLVRVLAYVLPLRFTVMYDGAITKKNS